MARHCNGGSCGSNREVPRPLLSLIVVSDRRRRFCDLGMERDSNCPIGVGAMCLDYRGSLLDLSGTETFTLDLLWRSSAIPCLRTLAERSKWAAYETDSDGDFHKPKCE
jgi:hypothetical protein